MVEYLITLEIFAVTILAILIFALLVGSVVGFPMLVSYSKRKVAWRNWQTISNDEKALIIAAVNCGALTGPKIRGGLAYADFGIKIEQEKEPLVKISKREVPLDETKH